jgi:putative nucleotidyltransferase with HDIG domain
LDRSPPLRSPPSWAELLPISLRHIAKTLLGDGHGAYLVGGSLRDLLLGRVPADWDLATSALPETVRRLFASTIPTGERHGTMTVLVEDDAYEVTTLREDGVYSDMRRPDRVSFTQEVGRDLGRRDFTINAMALDLASDELIDPARGQEDLERRLVRAVGDPDRRFAEDALRLLRAARFAAQLEFGIEESTRTAMSRRARLLARIAPERIQKELLLLLDAPRPSVGLATLSAAGLLTHVLPELLDGIGVTQNRFHRYDIFTHSIFTCDAVPPGHRLVRLAALLHDVAKPHTRELVDGEGTFYGHDKLGAEMADTALRRLRFSNADRELVIGLVRHHLFQYTEEWSDAAVRRFIRRVGGERIPALFALRLADARASGCMHDQPGGLAALRARIDQVTAGGESGLPERLMIDGRDVMAALGIGPGPEVGKWLAVLWEAVIDDPSRNTRESLLALLRSKVADDQT